LLNGSPFLKSGAGKHLQSPARPIFQYGSETDIGLLVFSGIWARVSPTAQAVVPVLLEFAERGNDQTLTVQISYRALARYSGVSSPNAIAAALRELEEIHWLSIVAGRREPGSGLVRGTSKYVLTPRSDELLELANANCSQMRDEIEAERKLRAEARVKRKHVLTR
jgi:hypothetical protein